LYKSVHCSPMRETPEVIASSPLASASKVPGRRTEQRRIAIAATADECPAIDREYAERLATGPDFVSYHAKSDFSEPHVDDLGKGGRQAILTAPRPGARMVVAQLQEAPRPRCGPRLI
jgi:hypothetical protein